MTNETQPYFICIYICIYTYIYIYIYPHTHQGEVRPTGLDTGERTAGEQLRLAQQLELLGHLAHRQGGAGGAQEGAALRGGGG